MEKISAINYTSYQQTPEYNCQNDLFIRLVEGLKREVAKYSKKLERENPNVFRCSLVELDFNLSSAVSSYLSLMREVSSQNLPNPQFTEALAESLEMDHLCAKCDKVFCYARLHDKECDLRYCTKCDNCAAFYCVKCEKGLEFPVASCYKCKND